MGGDTTSGPRPRAGWGNCFLEVFLWNGAVRCTLDCIFDYILTTYMITFFRHNFRGGGFEPV